MPRLRQVPALHLAFSPSRIERRLMIALHGVVALVLLAMPMALPARLAGLALLLISAGLQLRRAPTQGALVLQPDGSWHLTLPTGSSEVVLTGRRLVTPWLVVMRLARGAQAPVTLVLWPDSAPADVLRHLRAWLRWGRTADQRS
ncbi:protein YgfX [Chitinimonas sp. BJYL2]|uniref:protein YgfX n=1 Tax=Chitinimonas sp. BJYL2 TaxID=2976696 RepID=UPI0027E51C6C|nr:protein YgfX [Chitinimonas sp. BJYL2]